LETPENTLAYNVLGGKLTHWLMAYGVETIAAIGIGLLAASSLWFWQANGETLVENLLLTGLPICF
jgi:hypothetical protein